MDGPVLLGFAAIIASIGAAVAAIITATSTRSNSRAIVANNAVLGEVKQTTTETLVHVNGQSAAMRALLATTQEERDAALRALKDVQDRLDSSSESRLTEAEGRINKLEGKP